MTAPTKADAAVYQPRHRANRAVDACGLACNAGIEGGGTCITYVGRHRAEAS